MPPRLPVATLAVAVCLGSAAQPANAQVAEIHSEHFLFGYPTGTPASNDLIIRDLYALSSNDQTKFADWVAYRLTGAEVMGSLDLERDFRTDPFLEDAETLEASHRRRTTTAGLLPLTATTAGISPPWPRSRDREWLRR